MADSKDKEATAALVIMTVLGWARKIATETPNSNKEDHANTLRNINEAIALTARWRLETIIEIEQLLEVDEEEVKH